MTHALKMTHVVPSISFDGRMSIGHWAVQAASDQGSYRAHSSRFESAGSAVEAKETDLSCTTHIRSMSASKGAAGDLRHLVTKCWLSRWKWSPGRCC